MKKEKSLLIDKLKKSTKKIMLIVFTLIITLFSSSSVDATSSAPSSFVVNGAGTSTYTLGNYFNGWPYDGYWHFHRKATSEGKAIYCVEPHNKFGNDTYKLSGEADARYSYILANGYPNKSITGDDNTDYLITSFAVFYLVNPSDYIFDYMDLSNGTYKGTANTIVQEIAKLVNGSKNYAYTEPTIKVNANNNFTLSSDKKYYVSSPISITTTGTVGNYTVKLENALSGTIVTDTNGNTKSTFATTESFVVKVPTSSISSLTNEFSVSVSATGSIYKAYLYVPNNSSHQSTIALYTDSSSVSNKTTLKLNLTTEVQISKIDATTSKELPGAKLTVKDSNGKVIDCWTSTSEVHVIKGLTPGKYTLIEEIAPKGYILSTETVTFEVKADGTTTKVVMENSSTTVEISKIDATTGKELPGAKLTVKDANGEVIDSWTSTDEVHVIKGLTPGKYTLTEEIAPEGYALSTETITFEVKADGTTTKVVMENSPTVVKISKADVTTGEELAGAHLELKDEEGNLIEAWVSTDEPHIIENLKPGKYFLTETLAPIGYELSTETVEFTVNENGTVDGDTIMYNKPETVVEVPSTSSFKTITASLIGIIIIGLGSMIIYKNYKKNEEY